MSVIKYLRPYITSAYTNRDIYSYMFFYIFTFNSVQAMDKIIFVILIIRKLIKQIYFYLFLHRENKTHYQQSYLIFSLSSYTFPFFTNIYNSSLDR